VVMAVKAMFDQILTQMKMTSIQLTLWNFESESCIARKASLELMTARRVSYLA
jgi:hypothetical protein